MKKILTLNALNILLIVLVVAIGFVVLKPIHVLGQNGASQSCYAPDSFNCPITLNLGGGYATFSFSASPTSIDVDESSTLTWATEGMLYCESTDFVVPVAHTFVVEGQTFTWGATSGSVPVSPTGTKTYALTCSGLWGTVEKYLDVTVTGTTGGAPSEPTDPTNDPLSNGFPSIFEIDDDDDHEDIVDTVFADTADLLAGAQTEITEPYTFPRAGTWWIRACGDLPPRPDGTIQNEIDEENNCGDWTTVEVGTANECTDTIDNDGDGTTDSGDSNCASCTGNCSEGGSGLSCNVNTDNVAVGGSVTYTAVPSNGITGPYTWLASDGTPVTGTAPYTVVSRSFEGLGPYDMHVRGANGGSAYCPQVLVGCAETPSLEITASHSRVLQDAQTFSISYTGSGINAETCTVNGTNGYNATVSSNSCEVSGGPLLQGTIDAQTTFTITCGHVSDSVIVNIVPEIDHN